MGIYKHKTSEISKYRRNGGLAQARRGGLTPVRMYRQHCLTQRTVACFGAGNVVQGWAKCSFGTGRPDSLSGPASMFQCLLMCPPRIIAHYFPARFAPGLRAWLASGLRAELALDLRAWLAPDLQRNPECGPKATWPCRNSGTPSSNEL